MRSIDLHEFALQIAHEQHLESMVSTIEKELLHYEILDALDAAGILDELVFQGGTSLRLCYGAERYSEDLDFSGGRDFNAANFGDVKECVQEAVAGRYGVETVVKPPHDGGLVSAWTVIVNTTPNRRDMKKQRIKIEIASIDAHDVTLMPLGVNYDGLAASYNDLMIPVETRNEILADKVEAFVCSDHLRFRDIWDMSWLSKHPQVQLDKVIELRKLKESDYSEESKYQDRFPSSLKRLEEAFASGDFVLEMGRFLPNAKIRRTLMRKTWMDGTLQHLRQYLENFASEPDGHGPAEE